MKYDEAWEPPERWEIKPVLDPSTKDIQCYDMFYPDGNWHGSKRTMPQVKMYIFYCYHADLILAAREAEAKADSLAKKESKKLRIEKEIDNIDQDEYNNVLALMNEITSKNRDKVADARKKPAGQNWFIGQIRKQSKSSPVLIKKVITDWFENNNE